MDINLAPVPVGGCTEDSPTSKLKSWDAAIPVAQLVSNLSVLKSITVYMCKSTGATGTITADICYDSGGSPTSYNIGAGGVANTLDISTLPIYPSPAAAVTFTFPAATLNPTASYYVRFSTTVNYTHYIYYVENNTAYSGGVYANWGGNTGTRAYNLIGKFDDGQLPTSLSESLVVPNTGGDITLTRDMAVTSSGELTLDVASVDNLVGTGTIHVQPGGKIKLTSGQQVTVLSGTLYDLIC